MAEYPHNFQVGQTVFHKYTAEPFTITKISRSGMITDVAAPKAANYYDHWKFTSNEREAVADALKHAVRQMRFAERDIKIANDRLAEYATARDELRQRAERLGIALESGATV